MGTVGLPAAHQEGKSLLVLARGHFSVLHMKDRFPFCVPSLFPPRFQSSSKFLLFISAARYGDSTNGR